MNEFQAKHQPGVTGSNIYKMAAMCTRFNQSVALNLSLKKITVQHQLPQICDNLATEREDSKIIFPMSFKRKFSWCDSLK